MRRWRHCLPLLLLSVEPLAAADGEASGEPALDPAMLEMLGQQIALEELGVPADELVDAALEASTRSDSVEDKQ